MSGKKHLFLAAICGEESGGSLVVAVAVRRVGGSRGLLLAVVVVVLLLLARGGNSVEELLFAPTPRDRGWRRRQSTLLHAHPDAGRGGTARLWEGRADAGSKTPSPSHPAPNGLRAEEEPAPGRRPMAKGEEGAFKLKPSALLGKRKREREGGYGPP